MSPKVRLELTELDIPVLHIALTMLGVLTEYPSARAAVITELEKDPDWPGREQGLAHLNGILASDPKLTLTHIKELRKRVGHLLGGDP